MLKRENLSDKLADIYGNKIIHRELKSGNLLVETQISKEWEVSRSPVRDALHILERKRLIVKEKKGGYKVLELTGEYINHFYDTFNMIYEYAFAKAAQKITDQKLASLYSLAETAEKKMRSGDHIKYVEALNQFGETILSATDNPLIMELGLDLMPTAHRIVFAAIEVAPNHVEETYSPVRESCDYLKNRQPKEAAEAFRQFANASKSALLNYIETEGQVV